MADIKKDIKHLRSSFRKFIEKAGGSYEVRNTKRSRKDIYFFKERRSSITWHLSYSSNDALKKVIWQLDDIVKILGIFDEWAEYKNNTALYMSYGTDNIDIGKSNVIVFEEWKKVKEAARKLQSNEIKSEEYIINEIKDDEDYEELFGVNETNNHRRFWLSVGMERLRQGGREEIDDRSLFDEIVNDFSKIQGEETVWKSSLYGFISKSFNFEHIDIVQVDALHKHGQGSQTETSDQKNIKYLHRLMLVAETYNTLSCIIANKREYYNLTKNLKFYTKLHIANVYGGTTTVMKWNTEDSEFDWSFLHEYRQFFKKK